MVVYITTIEVWTIIILCLNLQMNGLLTLVNPDYIDLHGDIGNSDNNYLPGRKACAQRCNDKVDCKWFFFYVDIEGINQGYPAWCLLDDVFYQPAFIQCNIPWSGYNVGYNEISQ